MRAERGEYLFRVGWTKRRRAENSGQFGFIQLVIATKQNLNGLAFCDIHQRLDLSVGGDMVRRAAQRLDGQDPRRGKLLDGSLWTLACAPWQRAYRLVNIGGIAAAGAKNDFIFA